MYVSHFFNIIKFRYFTFFEAKLSSSLVPELKKKKDKLDLQEHPYFLKNGFVADASFLTNYQKISKFIKDHQEVKKPYEDSLYKNEVFMKTEQPFNKNEVLIKTVNLKKEPFSPNILSSNIKNDYLSSNLKNDYLSSNKKEYEPFASNIKNEPLASNIKNEVFIKNEPIFSKNERFSSNIKHELLNKNEALSKNEAYSLNLKASKFQPSDLHLTHKNVSDVHANSKYFFPLYKDMQFTDFGEMNKEKSNANNFIIQQNWPNFQNKLHDSQGVSPGIPEYTPEKNIYPNPILRNNDVFTDFIRTEQRLKHTQNDRLKNHIEALGGIEDTVSST